MDFEILKNQAKTGLQAVKTQEELEVWRIKYLGRNSEIALFLRSLAGKPLEEKISLGSLANDLRKDFESLREAKLSELKPERAGSMVFDSSLPGKNFGFGRLHPETQLRYDLNDAFKFLGFEIYEGPEISSEGYDFDYLNFPHDHPARESMDTYWIKSENGSDLAKEKGFNKLCLRPHLTGISVRYMQTHKPPFRFVYPGRAFRSEATDAGHERCFYQYEALIVNKDISLAGGKILVSTILERVFGRQVAVRMRPGFFPFVEPGFEIDMQCLNCSGKGCSVCKRSGWVEMMPGGPPHPNVLKAGGIDPKIWQGFYINIGLDRITMMKHAIDDIRLMHSGDLRFLNQF